MRNPVSLIVAEKNARCIFQHLECVDTFPPAEPASKIEVNRVYEREKNRTDSFKAIPVPVRRVHIS